MAGVKGRSGGARKGAGRKPAPKRPPAVLDVPAGQDPLEFLLSVMNSAETDPRLRVRAAVAAAQYVHPKRGEGGKKEQAEKAAGDAASGKFKPSAPPRLVVNNTKRG